MNSLFRRSKRLYHQSTAVAVQVREYLDESLTPCLTSLHVMTYISQTIGLLQLSALIWALRYVIDMHIHYTHRRIVHHFLSRSREPLPSTLIPGLSLAVSSAVLFVSMAWPCFLIAWNTELLLHGSGPSSWPARPAYFKWIAPIHRWIIARFLSPLSTKQVKSVLSSLQNPRVPPEIVNMIVKEYDAKMKERDAQIDACFQNPKEDKWRHVEFLKRVLQSTMMYCVLVVFLVTSYLTFKSSRRIYRPL